MTGQALVFERQRYRVTAPRRRMATVVFLALLAVPEGAVGQANDEPIAAELMRRFKSRPLSIGALVQVVGDAHGDGAAAGPSGFTIANARLSVGGELDAGFGYFVQGNLIGEPALLDALVRWRPAPEFGLQAGQFKAPFSRELLTSAASIDFVDRSRVVTALAPARQIGMQVGGAVAAGRLVYALGAFNGNRTRANANDNSGLLVSGRLAAWPFGAPDPTAWQRLEVGVNAARARDDNAPVGSGFLPTYSGERTLFGADARWRVGRLLLATELIAAHLEPEGDVDRDPYGWHATAGWMITPKAQTLLRWDAFRPDGLDPAAPDDDLIIAGLNVWPTSMTEIQLNWIIPANGGSMSQQRGLVNFQVGF